MRSFSSRLIALVLITFFSALTAAAQKTPIADKKPDQSLRFDANKYTLESATINGMIVSFRAYRNVIFVAKPVDAKFQCMNIYVPEAYYNQQTVGDYNERTAPVFFPNNIGGYMPAEPAKAENDRRTNQPNFILIALSKGYVVAAPGARGRTNVDDRNNYTGKAPAAIVDLKAAVRYLRFNDKLMAGDAEKIISNGTSAGGALSSLLGASGNNKDFDGYLKEIGAANVRDDIFAVSAYCPITNLDHADAAYEWQFNRVNEYGVTPNGQAGDFRIGKTQSKGILSPQMIELSNKLKVQFITYVNGLSLKNKDGSRLQLDATGSGSFRDLVLSFVQQSAQRSLDAAKDLSKFKFLTIEGNKVMTVDFAAFVHYQSRQKTPPAFDNLELKSPENELFGTSTVNAQHFTKFAADNSAVKGRLANPKVVTMMNPMYYIGSAGTKTSRHWRIRHGTIDRDASLSIPVLLATKIENNGGLVNLEFPWERGHAGDYDAEQFFEWIKVICK